MSKMEALRALVAERLTAAAEEIAEKMLLTPEMSPEQQRAVIRKRLLVVADEIFRILEIMIGGSEAEVFHCLQKNERQCRLLNIPLENETHLHQTDKLPLFASDCEANISSEQQKYDQRRSVCLVLKGPDPPQTKDVHTETGSEFINGKPSQFHQTQQAEKGTSIMMKTETEGEHSGVPPADLKVLSSKNPKARSEDKDVNAELVKSNKRTLQRGSQGSDVFKMTGRFYHKCAAGKKMKIHPEKTTPTNKSRNTGHSCCKVCGKFFQYKRSFLKHALLHEKSADVCGVCGKHLESNETLKVHLKTHSEENKQQTGNKQAECSDAESESDEDWKKSEGSDSIHGHSDKEESKEGSCLQNSKTKIEQSNKHHLETEESVKLHLSQTPGQSCCRVCGKFFRYKRSFLKHVVKHEQSADVCGKHLDSDESLKVHLKTHSEENSCRDQTDDKHSEAECSDAESREGDDEIDEDWEKSEGSDSEGSNEEDSKKKSKTKPKRRKNRDLSHLKYCCKVCGKSFCYRASFLKHVQEDERDADLCGVCGKHFETEESLKLHLQTYIRTNDCEVCGKHFDGHKQLEMHMRTHTGEKPFVCTVCGKAFAQNGNLMGHMRVHTGEKPYVCSVCGQSFSFKEYMRAHMRIHTGEKPFLCSVCGKGFRQRGTLKTHMMIHTGDSTHQCTICDKKFYKSGALKIHMRSHTGEKPYLCNVCGKSFTAGGSLTKHMGLHEGERTHCCSACGKTFLRKNELKRHAETHRDESIQLKSL